MTYPALAIANAFIDIGRRNNANDLTPMKLQKLVYFAHGWHLGAIHKPLINEQVEAWRYGPVVRSIYDAAKSYGNRPVTNYLEHPFYLPQIDLVQTPDISSLLNWVWSQYGRFDGAQLSNMTHEVGSPWHKIYTQTGGNPLYGTDIPQSEIEQHFAQQYDRLMPVQA